MWNKESDSTRVSSHEQLEKVPRSAFNSQSGRINEKEIEKIEMIDKAVALQYKMDCLESQRDNFKQTVGHLQDRIKELEYQAVNSKKVLGPEVDMKSLDTSYEGLQERVSFLEMALNTAGDDKCSLEKALQIMAAEKMEALIRIADLELGEPSAPSRTNLIEMTPLELAQCDLLKAQEAEVYWKSKYDGCEKRRAEEAGQAQIHLQMVLDKLKDSDKQRQVLQSALANCRLCNVETAATFQAIHHASSSLLSEETKESETAYRNTIQKLESALETKPKKVEKKRLGMETEFEKSIAKSMQSLADIKSLPDINYSKEISSLGIKLDESEKKIEILEDLLASYQERRLDSAEEFELYRDAQSAAMAMLHDKLEFAAEEKKRLLAKHALQIEWYEADILRLDTQISEQDIEIERHCAESDQLKAFMVEIMDEYSQKCAEAEITKLQSNIIALDTKVFNGKARQEPQLMIPERQNNNFNSKRQQSYIPELHNSEPNLNRQSLEVEKCKNEIAKLKILLTVQEKRYEREVAELKVGLNVMIFFIGLQKSVAEMNFLNQSTEILKHESDKALQTINLNLLKSKAIERETEYSIDVERYKSDVERYKSSISQLELCNTQLKNDCAKLVIELESCKSELAAQKTYTTDARNQSEQSKALIEEQQYLITELHKKINEEKDIGRLQVKRDTQNQRSPSQLTKTMELAYRGEESLLLLFPDIS
jgi:hypothetical protein